jgi:hypothetical protein
MEFLIGAAGAFVILGVFALGSLLGWKAHARFARVAPVKEPEDKELKRLAAQQEAFRKVQSYSVETAYGMTGEEDKLI